MPKVTKKKKTGERELLYLTEKAGAGDEIESRAVCEDKRGEILGDKIENARAVWEFISSR